MNDFFNGYMTGISQVIIGYPLDTMIIYKQTGKNLNTLKLKNIFNGIKYPLVFSGFINSICFGCNYNIYNYTNNHYISGAITGLLSSIIISPIELYKIRSQRVLPMNIHLFTGLRFTMMREVVGSSSYFGIYNTLQKKNDNPLVSGGITGCCSWLISFPIDVIKTRVQCGETMTLHKIINLKNRWNGLTFCLTRALLVNSVGFYVFEKVRDSRPLNPDCVI